MLKYPSFLSYIAFYQKFPVKTKRKKIETNQALWASLVSIITLPYSIQFVWNTPSLSTR